MHRFDSKGLAQIISNICRRLFPSRRIESMSTLQGGKTNLNILIRFEQSDELLVFRKHSRGPDVCAQEVSLLRNMKSLFPVPEVIDAGTAEDETALPYLIYRFVLGMTFHEIRMSGSYDDMAEAAAAVGSCLSALAHLDVASLLRQHRPRPIGLSHDDFDRLVASERLEAKDLTLFETAQSKWLPLLQSFSNRDSLVHGDFNHRNIVLRKTKGTWRIAAVLDWELAFSGLSLWDPARFLCYERPDSGVWERAFMASLCVKDTALDANLPEYLRMLNVMSAARSLAEFSTQERFIKELQAIVLAGLRGKRTGPGS